MKPAGNRRSLRIPLWLVTGVIVLGVAVLAGAGLFVLRRLHRQAAHAQAARTVLDEGRLLVAHLAAQRIVNAEAHAEEDWEEFERQVQALYTVENGLEYVAVTRDGVIVFQKHTSALDGSMVPPGPLPPAASSYDIRMTRRLLRIGERTTPVVVFATRFPGKDGKLRMVEAALRKDTVDREERAATTAIASMFSVSLLTVLISFALCMGLVIWLMHREAGRAAQRRQEEHLTFAGVLANGIVHDFRNPMSAMRLDAQMLEKEVGRGDECRRDRVAELGGRIRKTIDRLDTVFQEFLYVSKPPATSEETLDVRSCVRECISLLSPRLEKVGVRVRLDMPDQPVNVLAYEASLQRALINVITNAEQHSPEGEEITVRVASSDRNVHIDVIDRGAGVAPRDRKHIFDMFHSSRPGGTGLGLFLAKTAVERCGGSIKLMTGHDEGAWFRITLRPGGA